jgi:hypothetical protein
MDFITPESPKRLIVVDFVDSMATRLFGDKYEYRIAVAEHDPLEKLNEIGKPLWTTILREESSQIIDLDGTLENEICINVEIVAKVASSHLIHTQDYLQDIEIIKNHLLGKIYDYKDNAIYGDIGNKEYPIFSTEHSINYRFGAPVLFINFTVLLKIHTENQ